MSNKATTFNPNKRVTESVAVFVTSIADTEIQCKSDAFAGRQFLVGDAKLGDIRDFGCMKVLILQTAPLPAHLAVLFARSNAGDQLQERSLSTPGGSNDRTKVGKRIGRGYSGQ